MADRRRPNEPSLDYLIGIEEEKRSHATHPDEEYAIRRAEDRFERHVYGEDRDY